jgi:ribosomal protein S18 acetylase RimI-like enzyme
LTNLQPITSANASAFKTVRLQALQDSPGAFSSTYARESQFSDDEWNQRIANWNGEHGVGYLAIAGETYCGIAGSILDAHDPATAQIISMWVAPCQRRSRVGEALIGVIFAWAKGRSARTLRLMVTSNNRTAIEFYTRLGFTMTGKTGPYPNDPAVFEYEMEKPIG